MASARLVGFAAAMMACGAKPALSPAAAAVVLADSAPPAGYVIVENIDVVDGKGCGLLGSPGSPEGAREAMQSAAVKVGASYVHITSAEKPPHSHQCKEHQHKLHGVAYRRLGVPAVTSAAAPVPGAKGAIVPSPTNPLAIQTYEGGAPAGEPAAPTTRSRVILTLAPGTGSEHALSVRYWCSGGDQRADLDVWATPLTSDWTRGAALSVRVKPESAMTLSVSFMDGNHAGYTQHSEPLLAGQWQTVRLPFGKFWVNPHGPQGDVPGAPLDRRNIQTFGFAPHGCSNGHFLIDDFTLE